MSLFSAVEMAPRDPILGLNEQYNADTNPNKVNLGVGVYFDDNGKLPLLQCVQAAEKTMMATPTARGYLPIDGIVAYDNAVKALVFGADSDVVKSGRVSTVQAIGGTGGLKIGADFLKKVSPKAKVLISDPSWENHRAIFINAGFEVESYTYYDAVNRGVNFEGMLASLNAAAAGTIVVLHACCHNPTGQDLTPEQWAAVADVLARRRLLPFLDMAYQGLGEDLDRDAASIRLIAKAVPEMLVAVSCSKNFGLYRERTGLIAVLNAGNEVASIATGQLGRLARTLWSMPPDHGAAIVDRVLSTPELRQDWMTELRHMANRINSLRNQLADRLTASTGRDFAWVKQQRGMFSRLPLSSEQVIAAREQHHIYMAPDGRINIAGVSPSNVERLAESLAAVMKG